MTIDRLIRLFILLTLGSLAACASLPTHFEKEPSQAFTGTQDTFLGRETAKEAASHPGLSGFYLLPNGLDAFTARALLAKQAERSIDAQYYLYHNDLVGRLFTWQLVQAADRGTVSSGRDRRNTVVASSSSIGGPTTRVVRVACAEYAMLSS